ncbi:MAG: formate dehydrogenase subunit alpha [Dehalococcoidia bacterium]|nr:formate dehydrogenase subunit alpha [Chloroflexota bacterium]MCK4242166.1 formate dehydrogenase subunit alpha [Dehalococcoidia bacterium]
MVRFVPTVCPYCGAGCGLLLVARDNRVIGTRPWQRHPVNEGKLCIKGWNAHEFIHHSERLTAPLIKDGQSFREASWEEALKLVASRFGEIKEQHGPGSVAILSSAKCTNEENYVIQKFARAVVGTNNIDHCARLCHAPTVAGLVASLGSGAMTNPIGDLEQSDCILVIGSDTTSQHPLVAREIIKAKERGAKLILADPRAIQLSKQADIFLQLKPGTEIALLNGIMKVILERGLEDKEFIARRTEGIEDLTNTVKDYPLEQVEQITGVKAKDIEEAALTYGQAERAAIVYAMGITQHTTGTANVMSTANLALLTGNLGRTGTGVNPLRGQNNVQGACDLGALPDVLPGYRSVTDDAIRAEVAGLWGVASLPSEAGLTVVEMLDAAAEGKIKAMYIIGENPMLSDPDTSHVKKGLENLEFLVVQDIFPTETAQLAGVVLPSACWAEKEGTYTNTERRVQLSRKAVEPPGEAVSDWEIICRLAKAMGFADLFPYTSAEEIFEELRKVTPQYAGMTYERLNQPEGLVWPCPTEDHPGTPILHVDQCSRGKGKFQAVGHEAPAEEPDEEYPLILTTGRVASQWHGGSMTRRSPTLNNEFPRSYIEINPQDAKKLGVVNGDLVTVVSRRGEIETDALVTDRIELGVVFMPFHFVEGAANLLTNPALDPISKIPEFKVAAVRVSKAS